MGEGPGSVEGETKQERMGNYGEKAVSGRSSPGV